MNAPETIRQPSDSSCAASQETPNGRWTHRIYTRSQRAQDPDRSYAHASCHIRGHSLHDEVAGFCEYGVGAETTEEHEGIYQISYIATELKVRGNISETRCSPR